MDKHQAIDRLEEMVENREPGYFVAKYYLINLQQATGNDYDEIVEKMLDWINKNPSQD